MKPTYIISLFLAVSTALFAQRPDTPWQINAGLNVVDLFPTGEENPFFPNQGGFFEDFGNSDHWNIGVPAIGVYRTIKKDLSLGINFAFAGVTKIEGQSNRNLRYFSSDLQLKYAFFRDKPFSPYARLGAGVSSFNNDASTANNIAAEKRSAGHWVSKLGFDLKLTEKFGFFLEINFKNTFGDEGIPHFNHSLGFSYGLGTLDNDQDGVPDNRDECVNTPGLPALNGCPDEDGDGIRDSEDNCPEEAGTEDNQGCPWPDSDNDSVLDKDDNCPDEAANTDSGCPVVESTIIDALNKAGINILFPADGSELRGAKVLDAVAQVKTILDENPRGIVLIQGHASEDGSVEYNQALSESRAESVKSKLIELGVDPARLEVQAFGESRPVVADDISVSRRKSRRVVFSAK